MHMAELLENTEENVDLLILCLNMKTSVYLTYIKSINF